MLQFGALFSLARAITRTYETAYERNRKPLRYVVEAMARMKEAGCHIILHFAPWGNREEYRAKVERMGILGLVDELVPTSAIGSTAAEIMAYAASKVVDFNAEHENAVVWVVGSNEARVNPRERIYGFAPRILRQRIVTCDETACDVPYIHHNIGMLLDSFGLVRVPLKLSFALDPQDSSQVLVRGLGLDIITCAGMPFTMTATDAQFLVSAADLVLIQTADKDFASAQCVIDNMLAVLGKAAYPPRAKHPSLPDDDDAMDVDPPELFGDKKDVPPCLVRKGSHSFRCEHDRLAVSAEGARDAEFGRMMSTMQGFFLSIMVGRPDRAIWMLTSAADWLQARTQC